MWIKKIYIIIKTPQKQEVYLHIFIKITSNLKFINIHFERFRKTFYKQASLTPYCAMYQQSTVCGACYNLHCTLYCKIISHTGVLGLGQRSEGRWQCTLCIVHCTVHCTLYSTLHTVHYTAHWTLHWTLYSTLETEQYTGHCTVPWKLYSTLDSLQYTAWDTVQYTGHTVRINQTG